MHIGPCDISYSKGSNDLGSIRLYLDSSKNNHLEKYADYTNLYRKAGKYVGAGIALVGLGTVLIIINATLGAFVGALSGEILDHTPYLSTAISETLNTVFHTEYFTGNLDKLGATLGFVVGFFKSHLNTQYEIKYRYRY
jgi:hypothetical protein